MWLLWLLLVVGMLLAIDPLGLCSPGLLDEIEDLGEITGDIDEEGFVLPSKVGDVQT